MDQDSRALYYVISDKTNMLLSEVNSAKDDIEALNKRLDKNTSGSGGTTYSAAPGGALILTGTVFSIDSNSLPGAAWGNLTGKPNNLVDWTIDQNALNINSNNIELSWSDILNKPSYLLDWTQNQGNNNIDVNNIELGWTDILNKPSYLVDWTTDQGGLNIHANNITGTVTTAAQIVNLLVNYNSADTTINNLRLISGEQKIYKDSNRLWTPGLPNDPPGINRYNPFEIYNRVSTDADPNHDPIFKIDGLGQITTNGATTDPQTHKLGNVTLGDIGQGNNGAAFYNNAVSQQLYSFALDQDSAGTTRINAANTKSLSLCINAGDYLVCDGTHNLERIVLKKKIAIGDRTGSGVEGQVLASGGPNKPNFWAPGTVFDYYELDYIASATAAERGANAGMVSHYNHVTANSHWRNQIYLLKPDYSSVGGMGDLNGEKVGFKKMSNGRTTWDDSGDESSLTAPGAATWASGNPEAYDGSYDFVFKSAGIYKIDFHISIKPKQISSQTAAHQTRTELHTVDLVLATASYNAATPGSGETVIKRSINSYVRYSHDTSPYFPLGQDPCITTTGCYIIEVPNAGSGNTGNYRFVSRTPYYPVANGNAHFLFGAAGCSIMITEVA